ncbi:hypothetical protein D9M69_641090 [compost metagenome]
MQLPLQTVNEAIAEMAEKKIPADQMAKQFLKQNPDIWKAWVSEPVAEKVQASLN